MAFTLGPNQTKWIAALRSGNYKQCHGALKVEMGVGAELEFGYCCLGIANEVCNLGETGVATLGDTFHKMGLHGMTGIIVEGDKMHKFMSLAMMNDGGKTFTEIADFIEENPEFVFEQSV